jgi:5-methyltetrahydrofolate--homocysteine methyltransferase
LPGAVHEEIGDLLPPPACSYPKIFDDATVGAEARKVFDDAQAMLKEIIDGKWLTAKGIVGIYPAQSQGDDVLVFPPADDAQVRV